MHEPHVMVLPMFPLGRVLFPTEVLSLHVFEERYRALVADCTAGDGEFGVTLIERGSEVGGGDVRTDVGCVARILDVLRFEDGRYALIAVGLRRITIERWLPDAPYPRAEVVDWPDEPYGDPEELSALLSQLEESRRRVAALATEAGVATVPIELDLSADPATRVTQLAAASPVGPLDAQRLLSAPDAPARAALLSEQLAEAEELIRAQLGWGGLDPRGE